MICVVSNSNAADLAVPLLITQMTKNYISNANELINLAPGDLIDEREAAALMGLAVGTLRNWRSLRQGPRFRKIGTRAVRYCRADVAAFIAGQDVCGRAA